MGKVDGETQTIQEDADVVNIFERTGGKLLILGAPGAGKTTTLLRLAKMLLEKAQKDEFAPIPVIFELSEWAQERKPLAEWLPQVIAFRTQSKPERWHDWFLSEKPHILPLLDGLDEVPAEYRAECVQRINEFSAALTMKVVVCSRSIEYEQLGEKYRLMLNGAVELQPLTDTQIENYLRELGMKTDALRLLMIEDDALRELARQPLMLNMLVLAYQGQDALERFFTAKTPDEHHRHIFARFLHTRFEMLLNPAAKYEKDASMKWLRWLAKQMNHRKLQAFFIEELQPYWLRDELTQEKYFMSLRIIAALAMGIFAALWLKIFTILLNSINFLYLPFSELWCQLAYIVCAMFWGILFGLPALEVFNGGTGLVLLRLLEDHNDNDGKLIVPIESVKWSTTDFLAWFPIFFVLGHEKNMRFMFAVSFIVCFSTNNLIFSILLGLAFLIISPLTKSIDKAFVIINFIKKMPNEAIWSSWHISIYFVIIKGLIYGFIYGLTIAVIEKQILRFPIGLFIGIVFGFLNNKGIEIVIQHIILRIMLTREGSTPMNYAAFLEECVRRKIMVRSGNGYKFLHRLLQEHIASSD